MWSTSTCHTTSICTSLTRNEHQHIAWLGVTGLYVPPDMTYEEHIQPVLILLVVACLAARLLGRLPHWGHQCHTVAVELLQPYLGGMRQGCQGVLGDACCQVEIPDGHTTV